MEESIPELIASPCWKTTYPGASIGILAIRGVANPERHDPLESHKHALEEGLRARHAGYDRAGIKALPAIAAYEAYYKRFNKTYHVQLQLESVALKAKPLPRAAALVEAMFMAELKNLLLTAGHDLDVVRPPVQVNVADGSERLVRINGEEQQLKLGDMFIRDQEGILSSVIYGPDQRTRITSRTCRALFTVYTPVGIDAGTVHAHLCDLRDNVWLVTPDAQVELLRVYTAG